MNFVLLQKNFFILKSKELIPLFQSDYAKDKSNYNLYALYCPSKYHDPKIRSFIDFLVEKFQDNIPWDEWINNE
ncbi:hypothetical protein RHO12_10990 [Orbus sturtevantii]|uniref:hypothetical protein n=1 Tax=Orbus sturtevantii TaxID=3074109 RepID=UPI00370DBFB8